MTTNFGCRKCVIDLLKNVKSRVVKTITKGCEVKVILVLYRHGKLRKLEKAEKLEKARESSRKLEKARESLRKLEKA